MGSDIEISQLGDWRVGELLVCLCGKDGRKWSRRS